MYQSPTPQTQRAHFISLLLLLGTKRFSDIARIWRHTHCISVFVRRLDTPEWARQHRFLSLDDVHNLGYFLDTKCLNHHDFIILKMRPFMAKTSLGNGRLHEGHMTFTENRFCEAFCVVKAFFKCVKITKNFTIKTSLKYDKHTTMSNVTNPQGLNPVPAAPLLLSLNGRPRIGLQSNTISGIVKRSITNRLQDLGQRWRPYVLRATSASYKLAYGIPVQDILKIGDWRSTSSLHKHYYFRPIMSLNPARLFDCSHHDWLLPRTCILLRLATLPPLPRTQNRMLARPDATNDAELARTLGGNSRRSARLSRR